MSVPERSELRVGDSDRQAMVDQLRVHFSEGRLTLDEFEDRAEKAMAARIRADLVPLMADLPVVKQKGQAGPPIRASAPPEGWDLAFRVHVAVWVVLSIFFLLLGIVTKGVWPVYPILSIGLTVGIHYGVKAAVEG